MRKLKNICRNKLIWMGTNLFVPVGKEKGDGVQCIIEKN